MGLVLVLLLALLVASCARMGRPDGGWYDETPPSVIGATPGDGSVNAKAKKINIFFDEFIKLEMYKCEECTYNYLIKFHNGRNLY